MASVVTRKTSRGGRRLYVVYRGGDGRQRWELVPSGLKKDADARKAAIEVELHESGGRWVPPASVKFGDYADGWLGRYAKANVKPRVYANYAASVRLHLKPALGRFELAAVGSVEVKQLIASMRDANKADSTIRNAVVPLREMLSHAVEDRLIASNPLAGIRLFGNKRRAPRKIVPPTRAQVDKIIAKAKPEARDAIIVAAATGARRGELFALRWADVDFDSNVIHVHAQNYGGEVTEDDTKTDAGERDLPLFASIRKLLLERKARMRYSRPQDFVFGSAVGTPMDPGNFVRREFKTALKAAGFDGFRWHDFRHFAVTALIGEGANILLIAKVAGHSDPSITLSVYSHLMPSGVTEAAEKFDPMRALVG